MHEDGYAITETCDILNLNQFYRLVHIVGLLAVIRRKCPAYQRSEPEVTAENILNRKFSADTVNEKWCTDVTEMQYGSEGGKVYLSAILDLKSRDIVSFLKPMKSLWIR